ncbi:hypothetical protein CLV62_15217 [Dysgonomonas alginatilytica]|uniref:Uncharacterized protein n=1 Tax=Dysgonomonas alginatilytica TaxID=1605892 RepID=A0A2V3PK51_9BACT|nr:hypothetical protein [Dysgonomonas alginatilytica]PXV57433.1 hypothetical protein CLV62_15217 [Dysgonomonas alginatilytica]
MENAINLNEQLTLVTKNVIDSICGIKNIPEGLLPHTVFVEEVNSKGAPFYRKYQMVDMDRVDGNCIVYDKAAGFQDEISLQAVNIDWLITFWKRYLELSGEEEPMPKTLCVFLFPKERFDRNATDEEIIADYQADQEQDLCVEKYTPDEFAAIINDNGINYQEYFTRFINY